uniref:Uncharacterized protein n=1 Tax=Anguilla anguilla TaxID=7936 RepID=A0A0E9TCB1_ANGAN
MMGSFRVDKTGTLLLH